MDWEKEVARTTEWEGKTINFVAQNLTNAEAEDLVSGIEGGAPAKNIEDFILSIEGCPPGTPEWGNIPVAAVSACGEELRRFFGPTLQRMILSAARRMNSASRAAPETRSSSS